MCGVVSYYNENTTKQDIQVLKKVLIESRIRGKHASGVTWWNGNKELSSKIAPIPIDMLVNDMDLNSMVRNGKIAMIAHARYSTSDIKYNQPIVGERFAIACNGVITQEEPEHWEERYGYKCSTKNDTELLLHSLENNDVSGAIEEFPESSMAVVGITVDGETFCFRNHKRPLWTGEIGEGKVVASTYDILYRAGVKNIRKVSNIDFKYDLQGRSMGDE